MVDGTSRYGESCTFLSFIAPHSSPPGVVSITETGKLLIPFIHIEKPSNVS